MYTLSFHDKVILVEWVCMGNPSQSRRIIVWFLKLNLGPWNSTCVYQKYAWKITLYFKLKITQNFYFVFFLKYNFPRIQKQMVTIHSAFIACLLWKFVPIVYHFSVTWYCCILIDIFLSEWERKRPLFCFSPSFQA